MSSSGAAAAAASMSLPHGRSSITLDSRFAIHYFVRKRDIHSLTIVLKSASYRVSPGFEDEESIAGVQGETAGANELVRDGRVYTRWQVPPGTDPKLIAIVKAGPYCIDGLDEAGNTPLHYAVNMRDEGMVDLLFRFGAYVGKDNSRGWTALDDAIHLQHRPLVYKLYRKSLHRAWLTWQARLPKVFDALEKIPDYYFELKWDFHSFIPFVSGLCPSDSYRVWKRGTTIRLDYTLIEYANMKSIRGNCSFFFMGRDTAEPGECYIVDWDKQVRLRPLDGIRDPLPRQVICFVDSLLVNDGTNGDVDIRDVNNKRKQTWRGYPKTEQVADVEAEVHELAATFEWVTKIRRTAIPPESEIDDTWLPDDYINHYVAQRRSSPIPGKTDGDRSDNDDDSDEFFDAEEAEDGQTNGLNSQDVEIIDVDRMAIQQQESGQVDGSDSSAAREEYEANRALLEQATQGGLGRAGEEDDGDEPETEDVDSDTELIQEDSAVTELLLTEDGDVEVTTDKKSFKTTLACAPDFMLRFQDLLPIVEVLTPADHPFTKAKDFLTMNLPGFPLKCSVPLYAALSVQYEFLRCEEWDESALSGTEFDVPSFRLIRRVPTRQTPEARAKIRERRREEAAKREKKRKK